MMTKKRLIFINVVLLSLCLFALVYDKYYPMVLGVLYAVLVRISFDRYKEYRSWVNGIAATAASIIRDKMHETSFARRILPPEQFDKE